MTNAVLLEKMKDCGAALLALAIIQQAADDYHDLKSRGITSCKTRDYGSYSKEEIEEFFNSEYCETLLLGLHISDHGSNLLEILKQPGNRKVPNKNIFMNL